MLIKAKVNSGNTVSTKYKVVDPKPTDNVLDASDSVPKMKVYYERRPSIIVEPSFGYYRGLALIIKNTLFFDRTFCVFF